MGPGVPDPTKNPKIKKLLAQLKFDYGPAKNPTIGYEITKLPQIFATIFNMPDWSPAMKAQAACIRIIKTLTGARAKNFASLCVQANLVRYPPRTNLKLWCSDGLPAVMAFAFPEVQPCFKSTYVCLL